MTLRILKRLSAVVALMTVIPNPRVTATPLVKFAQQDVRLTIDVPSHTATITAKSVAEVQAGWSLFLLNGSTRIESFALAGRPTEFRAVPLRDTAELPAEMAFSSADIETETQPLLVLFKSNETGTSELSLTYTAEFYQDVTNVRFSSEKVGTEVTGTISEQGAYLSPDAFFYPRGEADLTEFTLTCDIPEAWESIGDGNCLSRTVQEGRKVQSWRNPFPSDGVTFYAAPVVVRSQWIDSIEVAGYFFIEDTGLINDYLKASVDYIRMYAELIGPYPFERFTVVENFFPTGYGMPAWTLLGQQVLRLPFIIRTSLGHEVLHNWWGNGVQVDYDRGNWCEAAAVYGADYRYKLMESPAAARDYRKDILKQYVSYVNEGNDFPLRQFQSRSSPNTRTIGYNKGMMIYGMIEQEIGSAAFFDAWKRVYEQYRGRQISWEEWIEAFEKSSNMPLKHVIPQWIDRTGAPILDVEIVSSVADAATNTRSINLRLFEKSGETYRLLVPLRFADGDSTFDTTVMIESPQAEIHMTIPVAMTELQVDPEYHLFRVLYPQEVEPVIAAILGAPQRRFVLYSTDENSRAMFAGFAANVSEDSVSIDQPAIFSDGNRSYFPVMLNPSELPPYLAEMVSVNDSDVVIGGNAYPHAEHTFVLTGQNWNGFDKYMVVMTEDLPSLPRIGQLIPHYGKYSYLIFKGPQNVGKGQWPVKESPLRKAL
ncbi:MAG TPA: hypothetical protein VN285_05340 [Candidatus Deferrimicrobium sp.]|nr:hypothetical protein [Candidatus Deferrimicrobium sp.]